MEWKRKEGKERRRRNKADEEREEVETRSSGEKKKRCGVIICEVARPIKQRPTFLKNEYEPEHYYTMSQCIPSN